MDANVMLLDKATSTTSIPKSKLSVKVHLHRGVTDYKKKLQLANYKLEILPPYFWSNMDQKS